MQHSEAERFIALERARGEALIKADTEALDRLLAEEYLFIGPTGAVATKAAHLHDIGSGAFTVIATEVSDISVRVYDMTAIVTGTRDLTAKYLDRAIAGRFRFSNMFVCRDGRWQVVNAHSSMLE